MIKINFRRELIYSKIYLKDENNLKRRLSMFIWTNNIDRFNLQKR